MRIFRRKLKYQKGEGRGGKRETHTQKKIDRERERESCRNYLGN